MTTLKRYTPEEDDLILRNWWNPECREKVIKDTGRTKGSINFRYYSLLRDLGVSPGDHRNNKGRLSTTSKEEVQGYPHSADFLDLMDDIEKITTIVVENRAMLKRHTQELKNIRRFVLETLSGEKINDKIIEENRMLREKLLNMKTGNNSIKSVDDNHLALEVKRLVKDIDKLNDIDKLSQFHALVSKMEELVESSKVENV